MKKENIILDKSFNFSLTIIELYKRLLEKNEYVISKQILRSGTSIGANIEEAIAANSSKDFAYKMSIASKEARETKYWLKLLDKSQIIDYDYSKFLAEINEIINILTSIVKTTQSKLTQSKNNSTFKILTNE